ncbi:unnamed protein product [Adineta ricciae]|uniref:SAM domain-containing protein n=1 Tax=Adineta ricciae TaxID=249248 RepID=A0A814GM75_ADIRI|nr:unnamed protein product [Adineta ricciae]CAF1145542.1 unnamed protein product [Adineta ricciae]
MFNFSEKFQEQFSHVQQQFDKWTAFEQMYASVDLTKKLSMPYRYFLSQFLCQMNSQVENNDMFHHTVHQANAPAILACLLSDPDDKIISTLLLYLPLVSTTAANDKLLEAYRDVFVYLDSKLANPSNFSCTEQQLIHYCQQMKFFIQKHPSLQKFLFDIPQLSALATSGKPNSNENTDEILATQRLQQPLQCYSSVRSYQQISPPSTTASLLANFVSEGSYHTNVSQQPIRKDASDSGVDLSEPCLTNSVQNLLSSQTSQHSSIGRSHSANLGLNNEGDDQPNHQFVIKSSSSPTPEQTTTVRPSFVPLTAVLSAPAPSHYSYYSDFRHQNSTYSHQQGRPTLTISDEDEEEPSAHLYSRNLFTSTDKSYSDINATENNANNNRLRQFCSLRNRPTRTHMNNSANNSESVSQYLGVDGVSGSTRNTFIQPNSGMRDVPKWLKNLRLHKYAFFFSQMTYDQMMGLTIDQLKEGKITDGACTKILLNIKKLKERQVLLQQCLIDIDNEQIDMKTALQHLNDLMLTPIRAPQTDQNNNDNEENLPKLIMQVLEKVYHQLTSSTSSTAVSSDMCNNLVGLFDRCYKHEAFSPDQRHKLLHWRGPLCNKLQTSGKIEYKSMQSSSSSSANRRPQLKPQTSMGNMNSTQIVKPAIRNIKSIAPYYPNYQSTSIPLSRQHNSDLPSSNGNNSNPNEINFIRRPAKSPTLIFTPNNDSPDETGATQSSANSHLSIVSSHSLQEQTSYHQTQPYITERSGIGGGSLRPSFNYVASTSQRTNGGYLAANQHQLLTRKTSIDPYGESRFEDKNKLCKTFSDPSRIRFCHPIPNQQSANHLQIASQSKTYQSTSTPYSSRQYLSRSQPASNNLKPFFELDPIAQSPIQKSFSDKEASVYFKDDENNNHLITTPTSSSNDSKPDDAEFALKQRHNSTEFDTLCRQVTESAISDDVIDEVMEQKYSSDIQTTKSSSASSIDTE